MTRLSAWCQTAPEITRHDAQHAVCEMRLEAGLLPACGCPDHKPTTKKDAA
jgi:hypothetical protein